MIQVCAYLLIFQSSLFLFSHVWSINEKCSQIHFQSLWRHVALNRKHHKKGHFLRSSQRYYSWWSLFMKSDRHPPNAGSVLCMASISSFFFLVTNCDKWKYRLTFSLWNEQFHLGLLEKLNNFFSGKFIYADRAVYRRRTPHLLTVVINSYILLTNIKQAASFNLLFRSLEELNSSGTMIVQTPMLIIRAETHTSLKKYLFI